MSESWDRTIVKARRSATALHNLLSGGVSDTELYEAEGRAEQIAVELRALRRASQGVRSV